MDALTTHDKLSGPLHQMTGKRRPMYQQDTDSGPRKLGVQGKHWDVRKVADYVQSRRRGECEDRVFVDKPGVPRAHPVEDKHMLQGGHIVLKGR